ncbi:MAG: ABC transporter ATP-binding protein [Pseudomonadota bacterium]
MLIDIHHLNKRYITSEGEFFALKDINITVHEGEFICLLGPSGCGKSTLLNAIAGFSLPTSGTILINGEQNTAKTPGPDRGMVFQEYALFPWMTVAQNISFGLEIKNVPTEEINSKVESLLQQLNLYAFRASYPKDLSGGMRQRVAIARVLALDSPIMLMDEPFGALDALTRQTLQDELLNLWAKFHKTIIFVTHSIDESIYLADRVLVMSYRPGTIKQDIRINLERPRDTTCAEFNTLKRELTQSIMEEHARANA